MAHPTRLDQDIIDDYVARELWDRISITDMLKRNAETCPDGEAVIDSSTRLTWSELDGVTDRVALGLMKMGMKRDQALVAQLPTSATNFIILLACQKAGILTCFPPMTFRHKELKHILKTLNAAAVVTPLEYRNTSYYNMVREIAPDLNDLEYILVSGDEAPDGA